MDEPFIDAAVQASDQEIKGELTVDESGRLIIPPQVAARFGLTPGAKVPMELIGESLRLRRPVTSLAKVYVEPTSRCNLECRTCIRNAWDEEMGNMSADTFQAILDGLRGFEPVPDVFFGGFGEPLAHPLIGEMVFRAKQTGARVELITNGTLLSENRSQQLVDAGLDRLWVSLDGATPESYTDVRLAEALPEILANLVRFRKIALAHEGRQTELGVAFVAMKRNIADLPALLRLSNKIGASHYLVTNLLPYTQVMSPETLFSLALNKDSHYPSPFSPQIDLPRIDWNSTTQAPLYNIFRGYGNISLEGERLNRSADRCPFIARGATVIAWDGELSPCLALMHQYTSYLDERQRESIRYTLGNIRGRSLKELWDDPKYLDFRQRVQQFQFAPCTVCGGCELAEKNEEDCFGNTFPTCGGCLWAQGVVQCP
jgi:MoaA/NifB/PqqE/SkfB family radical SAM enzyme